MTFRIFVSSMFSDLKPERNALQADVFPKLEQLCAQNCFQFQAIDFRWAIRQDQCIESTIRFSVIFKRHKAES